MSCFWLLIIISQNQKSTNFIIIVAVLVVVMIIIIINNTVGDQKWVYLFDAIEKGKIAEVKMLFEDNRSLFLNSAIPDYAALV